MRAGKGSYGTANIAVASLANPGQQLSNYDTKDENEDELTPSRNFSSAEKRDEGRVGTHQAEEAADVDDLDEILAGDLDSPEYDRYPTFENGDNSRKESIIMTTTPPEDETPNTLEGIARIRIEERKPIEQPQSSDTQLLEKLLTKGYDWRVRPPAEDGTIHGGPVVVAVNMLIRSISKIDNVNMEYSVQLTFRESWRDDRLKYGLNGESVPDFLILTAGQQIWMPDSFFQNEKQAYKHMIDKPNVLIRVHKDGTILYSVRISLVLSCPMHLQFYPMDVQQCFIDLASYAYTTNDIEYVWKSDDPVQLKQGLSSSLPSFQLNNVSTTYCTSKTNTGTYSCLRTVLQLKRQFSYYLLQLYIPSCMLVIVSWVSFWIDRTAVPARVTLGVTTLLTMTTQSSGINAKLPPVAYIKAIDVWIGGGGGPNYGGGGNSYAGGGGGGGGGGGYGGGGGGGYGGSGGGAGGGYGGSGGGGGGYGGNGGGGYGGGGGGGGGGGYVTAPVNLPAAPISPPQASPPMQPPPPPPPSYGGPSGGYQQPPQASQPIQPPPPPSYGGPSGGYQQPPQASHPIQPPPPPSYGGPSGGYQQPPQASQPIQPPPPPSYGGPSGGYQQPPPSGGGYQKPPPMPTPYNPPSPPPPGPAPYDPPAPPPPQPYNPPSPPSGGYKQPPPPPSGGGYRQGPQPTPYQPPSPPAPRYDPPAPPPPPPPPSGGYQQPPSPPSGGYQQPPPSGGGYRQGPQPTPYQPPSPPAPHYDPPAPPAPYNPPSPSGGYKQPPPPISPPSGGGYAVAPPPIGPPPVGPSPPSGGYAQSGGYRRRYYNKARSMRKMVAKRRMVKKA
ncbi:hypothetical protein RB195_015648 [Necator americanus]|uniref:Ig-like domain-containing protein n=1 Tax=Necator americanus TaxID=51031 RepID=A0ABR1E5I4_NECAM